MKRHALHESRARQIFHGILRQIRPAVKRMHMPRRPYGLSQRHRQRSRTRSDLEYLGARDHAGPQDQIGGILGIDDAAFTRRFHHQIIHRRLEQKTKSVFALNARAEGLAKPVITRQRLAAMNPDTLARPRINQVSHIFVKPDQHQIAFLNQTVFTRTGCRSGLNRLCRR